MTVQVRDEEDELEQGPSPVIVVFKANNHILRLHDSTGTGFESKYVVPV